MQPIMFISVEELFLLGIQTNPGISANELRVLVGEAFKREMPVNAFLQTLNRIHEKKLIEIRSRTLENNMTVRIYFLSEKGLKELKLAEKLRENMKFVLDKE